MTDSSDEGKSGPIDPARRNLLKQLGAMSAAPVAALAPGQASPAAPSRAPAGPPQREALETLTAAESDTLEAIVARLIPTDANGPGAAEARAALYIDRALGGPLASSRRAYAAGLAALDAWSREAKGAPFAKLPPDAQDQVLSDMQKNAATGFTPSSSAFFNLLLAHTIQGTFCDPYYGGNANFVGWDLIGYPGVRVAVTAEDQRLGATLEPNHKSAYDEAMFAKRGGGHGH